MRTVAKILLLLVKLLSGFSLMQPNWCEAQIVVNEIQPYPFGDEPEWIELFNTSSTATTLTDCYIYTRSSRGVLPQLMLESGQYAILTRDTLGLFSVRTIPPKTRVFQMALPTLPNTIGMVVIKTKDSTTLDSLYYDGRWSKRGISLEKIDPMKPGVSRATLLPCIEPDSATCGYINSRLPVDIDGSVQLRKNTLLKTIECIVKNAGKLSIQPKNISLSFQSTIDNRIRLFTYSPTVLLPNDSAVYSFSLDTIQSFVQWQGIGTIYCQISTLDGEQRLYNNSDSTQVFLPLPNNALSFNEIMYETDSTRAEFVEFVNNSDNDISLEGLVLCDNNECVALPKVRISPKGYVVCHFDSSFYRTWNNFRDNPNVVYVGFNGLSNSGENLLLKDPNGILLDSCSYLSSWHSKDVFTTKNLSLEKLSEQLQSSSASSWSSSTHSFGGTPLNVNTLNRTLPTSSSVIATPNPFSPRSKHPDKRSTVITFLVPSIQSRTTVTIYDVTGARLRTLQNIQYTGSDGAVQWDGRTDEGFELPAGPYIIVVQSVDSNSGEESTQKLFTAISE